MAKSSYKDVKFSTLIDKLNKGIRAALEAGDPAVVEKDYGKTIGRIGNDLLQAWGYPLRLSYGYYDFDITTAEEDDRQRVLVAALDNRYEIGKGCLGLRPRRFKRFVKSGPRFEDKVSALIERRRSGVTFQADEAAWEIQKLGFSSPEEFIDTYNQAKKLIDDEFGVWCRYERLSEEEKASIRGQF